MMNLAGLGLPFPTNTIFFAIACSLMGTMLSNPAPPVSPSKVSATVAIIGPLDTGGEDEEDMHARVPYERCRR